MNKLLLGDCLKKLREIEDNSVDFILTDPPYNLGLFMKKRATNLSALRQNHFSGKNWDLLEEKKWKKNMEQLMHELQRVIKDGGSMIMFMAIIKLETVIKMCELNNFYYKTTGIWHKKNPMPRNKDLHFINSTECWLYFVYNAKTGTFNNKNKTLHDFFESGLTPGSEKKHGAHPTQKPLALLDFLISTLSNKGDVVLDPFMGSGSTGASSAKLQRDFIGIELEKDYFQVAKKNIESEKQCQLEL
tara:strand:+ start:1007 stop:1741 length:735 start_codon:yes stop_codon:yes gene_type:complete